MSEDRTNRGNMEEDYVLHSLHPDLEHDDLRVLNSYILSDDDGNAKAMIYHLLISSDDEPDVWTECIEVVKLLRLVSIPKELREKQSLMKIHGDLMTAIWRQDIFFLMVCANILKPRPMGLIYCYGARRILPVPDMDDTELALRSTIEVALEQVEEDYIAIVSLLRSNYRQSTTQLLTLEEATIIKNTMENASNLQVLRGIPRVHSTSAQGLGKAGMKGGDPTPDSQEQNEELFRGMMKHHFAMLVNATPIQHREIIAYSKVVATKFGYYKSRAAENISTNIGMSMPMVFAGNLSASLTHNNGVTDTDSSNLSYSEGVSNTNTQGVSLGNGISDTNGVSRGISQGIADSNQQSFGVSEGIGHSSSDGTSHTDSISHSKGESLTNTVGQTVTNGQTVSHGQNYGTNQGTSQTLTNGTNESYGTNHGVSRTTTDGTTVGQTNSVGTGTSAGHSNSYNYGESQNRGMSVNSGTSSMVGGGNSASSSSSSGHASGMSTNEAGSIGMNASLPFVGVGGNGSLSNGSGTSEMDSFSNSSTMGSSANWSDGVSSGRGASVGEGVSRGWGQGDTTGTSTSQSQSNSLSNSHSVSNGESAGSSHSVGTSRALSNGTSQGSSQGTSYSVANSHSVANSQSQSHGQSVSDGWSKAQGTTHTDGLSTNSGQTASVGRGQTQSLGVNDSLSKSAGTTQNISQTQSQAAGTTQGRSEGTGHSLGRSEGVANGLSAGTGANMGLGPSVGMSKTYTKYDEVKANMAKVFEEQNLRFTKAIADGAFYVEVFISSHDPQLKKAIGALAEAAFGGDGSLVSPVQVYTPPPYMSEHLLRHMSTFTTCTKKEVIPGIAEAYEHSTVLLPTELAGLTHPPRVEAGGIFTTAQNIPAFTLRADKQGEIYVGKQISHETGEPEFDYSFKEKELMHILVCGASGCGKTTTSQRIAEGIAKNCPKKKILALDWKKSWRILKRFVPDEDFDFFSLYAEGVRPIRMQVYVPPMGISVMDWMNKVHESLCLAYGFGNKQKGVFDKVAEELFLKQGVLEKNPRTGAGTIAVESENAYDLVYNVTLADVLERINALRQAAVTNPAGRNMVDAYDSILTKTNAFMTRNLREMYCSSDRDQIVKIEDLINGKRIIVLEGGMLDDMPKKFILGLITWGVFLYSKDMKSFEKLVDERLFILEEAHEVFPCSPNQDPPLGVNEDIYQILLNEAREYGLFAMVIGQAPQHLPDAVLTNVGVIIAHRLGTQEDVQMITTALSRNARLDDRDVPTWLTKQPIGMCVIKINNQFSHFHSEPILVRSAPVTVLPPHDEEIIETLKLPLPRRFINRLIRDGDLMKTEEADRTIFSADDLPKDEIDLEVEKQRLKYWEDQFKKAQ